MPRVAKLPARPELYGLFCHRKLNDKDFTHFVPPKRPALIRAGGLGGWLVFTGLSQASPIAYIKECRRI